MNWRRRVVSAIGLVILWSLMACRGPALRTGHVAGNPAAVIAAVGDPATNVMIVPASAAGTLGAGVTGRNLSPFPDYDQRVAQSVYNRWLVLLHDEPAVPPDGKVAVEFNLTSEGYVYGWRTASEDLPPRIQELCKRAIVEVAPFPKWPPEMKKTVGADVRAVRFTFHLKGQRKVP